MRMRDLIAAVVALALVFVAASLGTTLRRFDGAGSAPAIRSARWADDHRGDSGGGRPRALQRGWAAFHYGERSIDKDLIVAVRVLINGAPIASYVSQAAPRGAGAPGDAFRGSDLKGFARDRWDVAIETETATILVECGAIRERVSQELARTVFDAIKRELERRDAN
jgi:hypothetical protein